MGASRRSARRVGAIIGYSTTLPSAWKLTQLFGKQASGFGGSGVSSATTTSTPASASREASLSNSASAAAASAAEEPPDRWNRLESAVSGLAPNRAGRII